MKLTPDAVLEVLGRSGDAALSPQEILRRLRAPRSAGKALKRMLRTLTGSGRVSLEGNRYRVLRSDGRLDVLVVAKGKSAEARAETLALPTVAVETRSGDRLLVQNAADARVGDRVLVVLSESSGEESTGIDGVAERVVERPTDRIVGLFETDGPGARRAWVTPYGTERKQALRIPERDRAEARDGDVVEAAVEGKRKDGSFSRGRVTRRLGRPGDPEADFRAMVFRHRLPTRFPDEVLAEAGRVRAALGAAELAGRRDLRDGCFLTIDPETARDHDDALFVEGLSGKTVRLLVAIADVSHYVPAGSALDREAIRRGNSVYFADRAIPMLPERLSSGLCSLVPDEDRLAFVVELRIDARGRVTKSEFAPAIIRSRARLGYLEAAAGMELPAGQKSPHGADVAEQLRLLGTLAGRLRAERARAGSLDLDLPEPALQFGPDGRPSGVARAPRTIAHRAVEEAMLAANRAVAEQLIRAETGGLFRVHEAPAGEALEELRELLGSFDLLPDPTPKAGHKRDKRDGRGGTQREALDAPALQTALERAKGRPIERSVNFAVLRAMKQAHYAAENRGHFALAFPAYLHFTSPIRRYADLVVHRALRASLGRQGSARARDRRDGDAASQSEEERSQLARHLSVRERIALVAERDSTALKMAAFIAARVGDTFAARISGLARPGIFVTLDDLFVQGLVPMRSLPEYVELDERAQALVAASSGRRYRLGDAIEVRLESVDLLKGQVAFSPAKGRTPKSRTGSRRPTGRGKPRRRS